LEKRRLIINGRVYVLIGSSNVSDWALTAPSAVSDIYIIEVLKICSFIPIETAIFVGHTSIK